jgi:NADPH:quinone reductase-like Zn-dependent oxidoreductase
MKAIVQNDYGSPDVLELKEIDRPVVKDDGVLVRVHAAAVHAGDYFAMRGMPVAVRLAVGLQGRIMFQDLMWQGTLRRSART